MLPEVLIYIQKIKSYFEANEEVKEYFIKNVTETEFYNQLIIVSENNFKKNGEAELTMIQFEELRNKLSTENYEEIYTKIEESTKYIKTKGFGRIYLN